MRKVPIVTFVDIDAIPTPRVERPDRLAEMLETLARERVTLVFCSQRTRAQVESVRQAFGVFHPFVCEGGAAVFVPERYFGADLEKARRVGGYQAIEFADPYETVVDALRKAAERLNIGVLGFNDMSVEQVARELHLSLLDARLAKLREYVEPFRLLSANHVAERRLFRALESAGLTCRPGGAFNHVGSVEGPQSAVAGLTAMYRVAFGGAMTAGAGEGELALALAPHVDVALPPLPVEPDHSLVVENWLDTIVRELGILREVTCDRRMERGANHRRVEPRTVRT